MTADFFRLSNLHSINRQRVLRVAVVKTNSEKFPFRVTYTTDGPVHEGMMDTTETHHRTELEALQEKNAFEGGFKSVSEYIESKQ